MNQQVTSLTATFKTVASYGTKYAADFPAASLGGQQFALANAAHSLVLLGTAGLDGKFHLPRSGGDQAMLNSARAFQTDAAPFAAQLISLGLPADFLSHLGNDITIFENAITAKGAGVGVQAGATGGLEDTAHKAAIALHVAIRPLLYQVSPTDPLTFAAVATVLMLVGTSAAWVPARRAARLDPARALRSD